MNLRVKCRYYDRWPNDTAEEPSHAKHPSYRQFHTSTATHSIHTTLFDPIVQIQRRIRQNAQCRRRRFEVERHSDARLLNVNWMRSFYCAIVFTTAAVAVVHGCANGELNAGLHCLLFCQIARCFEWKWSEETKNAQSLMKTRVNTHENKANVLRTQNARSQSRFTYGPGLVTESACIDVLRHEHQCACVALVR